MLSAAISDPNSHHALMMLCSAFKQIAEYCNRNAMFTEETFQMCCALAIEPCQTVGQLKRQQDCTSKTCKLSHKEGLTPMLTAHLLSLGLQNHSLRIVSIHSKLHCFNFLDANVQRVVLSLLCFVVTATVMMHCTAVDPVALLLLICCASPTPST